MTLRIRAHAKINLALAVAPPDADSMHPIASWMAPIDLADDIELTRLPDGEPARITVRWASGDPVGWPLDQDLARRAHATLEADLRTRLPVRITVTKSIPAGGGVGGGSADGAAVLRGLDSVFALRLPGERLRAIASTLGSDLPFFIDDALPPADAPRPALVTGLGDRIERLPRVPGHLVLLLPPFGCPTGEVYRAFDRLPPHPPHPLRVSAVATLARAGALDTHALFNDLAPAAEAVRPELADLRARASALARGPVHVSGSGSTLFIPASAEQDARDLAHRLHAELRVPTLVTRLV